MKTVTINWKSKKYGSETKLKIKVMNQKFLQVGKYLIKIKEK